MTNKTRRIVLWVVAATCVTFVSMNIFGFVRFALDIRTSKQEFGKRYLEATKAIDGIYAYYALHGQWPTQTEVEAPGNHWLPAEWVYEINPPEDGGPTIFLHGTYHMFLAYRFAPPQHGPVSDTWTLDWNEGDSDTFKSEVPYR